ncbi:peptidylprolyl isomerase [Streptomyces sp. ACA25]|uniref:peptidylprolyl isomerase n=1 Tax=Streptomyces sp. ACA25 TaxID=3022596 RepID=UPI002307A3E7|nr:peptidylprolyl isomerase [Streptomyces sp. ACA25]MDB1088930.1 peptidylprolyl isomerase [Streptomyces sp. ACA25]
MVSREQRRRQLARAKQHRQESRREPAARHGGRRRTAAVAVLLVAVLTAGTVALALAMTLDSGKGGEGAASAAPEDPCAEPAAGEPSGERWDTEPDLDIDPSAGYSLLLETTCGDIEIALDAAAAPRTVNSFRFLAGHGYFDHTRCHRLVTGPVRVLQCGDPEGTGRGGPGYSLPDENLDDPSVADGVYPAGTVAMANRYDAATGTGRNSGGSQFFLVYEDSPLPPDFTPFGTVTGGAEVLERISEAGSYPDPATGNTAPHATVVIDRATVSGG